jgi:CRISPR-associated protein Csd1
LFSPDRLASRTVRDPQTDTPSIETIRAIYRVALLGTPLPRAVLAKVIRQFNTGALLTDEHAALVRLALAPQPGAPSVDGVRDRMAGLDRRDRRPAYLCGRLLAVLEDIHRQARGHAWYVAAPHEYALASSTPLAVFGRMLRATQPQLARLRRDRFPAYQWAQTQLREILAGFPDQPTQPAFPRRLSLEDQGLFALGFYHQQAATPDQGEDRPASGGGASTGSEAGLEADGGATAS